MVRLVAVWTDQSGHEHVAAGDVRGFRPLELATVPGWAVVPDEADVFLPVPGDKDHSPWLKPLGKAAQLTAEELADLLS